MYVKALECIEYPDDRSPWTSETVADPAWPQIEAAIRRLDRSRFPIVLLWPDADEETHEIMEGNELFQVVGGTGAYWVASTTEDWFERQLDFPEQGEERVEVWTSGQGFPVQARHVCFDLEIVLQAARHYAEHGRLDPRFPWQPGGS
jgi:Immunity protein Imm1